IAMSASMPRSRSPCCRRSMRALPMLRFMSSPWRFRPGASVSVSIGTVAEIRPGSGIEEIVELAHVRIDRESLRLAPRRTVVRMQVALAGVADERDDRPGRAVAVQLGCDAARGVEVGALRPAER